MASLPYHEPHITTILSLTSFLLALNGSRYVLDRTLYCGLLGEILIGVVWGFPLGGTTLLSNAAQETVQSLGYLGLIGLVFEGGLKTSPSGLRKTARMSVSIATIGLCLPIGLSFLLLVFPFASDTGTAHPSPLAAFSAGASLCSTSLGTAFAILSAADLQETRMGVVLVGAAMMDDVVGLVMVKTVTALGSGTFTAWGVARPVVSSFALLVVTLLVTPYLVRPILQRALRWPLEDSTPDNVEKSNTQKLKHTVQSTFRRLPHLHFILATLAVIAFVSIAAYIDASILFAAFIAGGFVRFLGDHVTSQDTSAMSSTGVYDKHYHPVIAYVLAPFFFASIELAIPIREMFNGSVLWKGIIYAIMMMVAKAAVGSAIYGQYLVHKLRHGIRQNDTNNRVRAPHNPAATISLAMIARGEIGFLIASLSFSAGTLTVQSAASARYDKFASSEELFLVIIWAVVLGTLLGPIGVGIVVKKLRHLDREGSNSPPNEVCNLTLGTWAKELCSPPQPTRGNEAT